jgi:hypothetical protein
MSSYEPSAWRVPSVIGGLGCRPCHAHFTSLILDDGLDAVDVLAELKALRAEVNALKKELAARSLEQRLPRDLADLVLDYN